MDENSFETVVSDDFVSSTEPLGSPDRWISRSFLPRIQPAPTRYSSKLRSAEAGCGCFGVAKKHYHLRVAGPSMGGKTSLIRYLLRGQGDQEISPTDAMEVSEVFWNATSLVIWDFRKFGDDDSKAAIRAGPIPAVNTDQPLVAQKQVFDALVYVVDAADSGRLKIATRDFKRFLKTYHDVPVALVLGNKTDLNPTIDANKLRAELKVLESACDRECEVFLISSWTGEGIDFAFEWLSSRINQKEGVLASCFDFFNFQGCQEMGSISCGRFGTWDPMSMFRFSRLS